MLVRACLRMDILHFDSLKPALHMNEGDGNQFAGGLRVSACVGRPAGSNRDSDFWFK